MDQTSAGPIGWTIPCRPVAVFAGGQIGLNAFI
jgi:hypothetical protein